MDRYRVELENRDIECEISGNAVINADARLMDIMLDNLVMNTAKYALDSSLVKRAVIRTVLSYLTGWMEK